MTTIPQITGHDTPIYEHAYHRIKSTRHGMMLYNIHDVFIGKSLDLYGEWSWEELEVTLPYAHGIVIDAGAYIGTHTLVYARVAPHVVAFEPCYSTYQNLVCNLALNAVENVRAFNIALGDTIGMVEIGVPLLSVENNFGRVSVGQAGTFIPMQTIDSLGLSGVSLIKIDVEGHEEEVLRGAQSTLARDHPVLYVEADRPEKVGALIATIEALGYEWMQHEVPLHPGFGHLASKNLLCKWKGIA